MRRLPLPALLLPPPPPDHPDPAPALRELPQAYLFLFRGIRDPVKLRKALIAGRTEDGTEVPQCCAVDARMVLDVSQLLCACSRAVMHEIQGKMKTRTVYAETLYNMSPWNPISEAMKTWGVRDDTKDVLVLFLEKDGGLSAWEFEDAIQRVVDADERPLEELTHCADLAEICSAMKIPVPEDGSLDRAKLLRDVLSTMAIKGL